MFVVSTTRTGSGGVAGGGRGGTTRRINGDDLQPIKARILLMLALAKTQDPAEIQRMFREYSRAGSAGLVERQPHPPDQLVIDLGGVAQPDFVLTHPAGRLREEP